MFGFDLQQPLCSAAAADNWEQTSLAVVFARLCDSLSNVGRFADSPRRVQLVRASL